jgi:hypothetical protein
LLSAKIASPQANGNQLAGSGTFALGASASWFCVGKPEKSVEIGSNRGNVGGVTPKGGFAAPGIVGAPGPRRASVYVNAASVLSPKGVWTVWKISRSIVNTMDSTGAAV